jgi:hypothetical protein
VPITVEVRIHDSVTPKKLNGGSKETSSHRRVCMDEGPYASRETIGTRSALADVDVPSVDRVAVVPRTLEPLLPLLVHGRVPQLQSPIIDGRPSMTS